MQGMDAADATALVEEALELARKLATPPTDARRLAMAEQLLDAVDEAIARAKEVILSRN
jgi:hypothetical protein